MALAKILSRAEAYYTRTTTAKIDRLAKDAAEKIVPVTDTDRFNDLNTRRDRKETLTKAERKELKALSKRIIAAHKAGEKAEKAAARRQAIAAARRERLAAVKHYFASAFAGRADGRQIVLPSDDEIEAGYRRVGRWNRLVNRALRYPLDKARALWNWAGAPESRIARVGRRLLIALPLAYLVLAIFATSIIPELIKMLVGDSAWLDALGQVLNVAAIAYLIVAVARFITWLVVRKETNSKAARIVNGVTKVTYDAVALIWGSFVAAFTSVALLPFYIVDAFMVDREAKIDAEQGPVAPAAPVAEEEILEAEIVEETKPNRATRRAASRTGRKTRQADAA